MIRVIWGPASVSVYHDSPAQLPPGVAGMTAHPYGSGSFIVSRDFPQVNRAQLFIDPEPVGQTFCLPEGIISQGLYLEGFAHLLGPGAPKYPDVWMTEHGIALQLTDPNTAWDLKARFVLRAMLWWLNKGIAAVHLFTAWSANVLDSAFLMPDYSLSPALLALQRALATLQPGTIARPRQLTFSYAPIGPCPDVIQAGPTWPAQSASDRLALLPFQCSDSRFVVAVYVMSPDFRVPVAPMTVRLQIDGLEAAKWRLVDPLTGSDVPVVEYSATPTVMGEAGSITLDLAVTDTPRMLVLEAR